MKARNLALGDARVAKALGTRARIAARGCLDLREFASVVAPLGGGRRSAKILGPVEGSSRCGDAITPEGWRLQSDVRRTAGA
jgi:hypothetical protein